tara:strand:- start:264 stop:671 length:408 start_codon:yes stop_codon:yes gene_type:complete
MATQIKGTNQEFLDLLRGLEGLKEVKGKVFSLLVARNIMSVSKHLKPIEKAAEPSKEFQELSVRVQRLVKEEKNDDIVTIEEENKDLIEKRKAQLTAVEDMLKEKSSVSINFIKEEHVPNDITPEQILPLLSIIN